MKRFLSLLLVLVLLCPAFVQAQTYQKYQHYFFDTFDTVVTFLGYAESEDVFREAAALVESRMRRYHQIFDQYNPYDSVNNLYTINASAAAKPTKAEPELIALLLQIRKWRESYATVTNPAMGAVLRLWHDARTAGDVLPDLQALLDASAHDNYDDIIIDETHQTIFFADPLLQLDLGAVAKGYAAQLTADALRNSGFASFILNAGGNVVCGDAPLDGRTFWTVAIEDVDGSSIRQKIGVLNQSIVTSGDYQRYYELDGVRYHHLIDPATLLPATHMRAVSIIHPDSGLADFLSTTAFLLPYAESRALIDSIPGAEGSWLLYDGTTYWTDGFQPLLDLAK